MTGGRRRQHRRRLTGWGIAGSQRSLITVTWRPAPDGGYLAIFCSHSTTALSRAIRLSEYE